MYKMMTPGPVMVRENVRAARSRITGNPDVDPDFYNFYRDTCRLISDLIGTSNETLILGGEGILGIEASCASLTEPGDRVLVLDNGVFGHGFADFVRIYGGEPVLYTSDYSRPIDPEALNAFLQKDHSFRYAAVVHCDTPSGVLNDIHTICPLLKSYGILTVVDAVASMFAEDISMEADGIDVLCGGSQKVVSAPAGLCFVTLSQDAKDAINGRKTPIASFYASLKPFFTYYEDQWFPYTMPISDITGLREALHNLKTDTDVKGRHARIAHAAREALTRAGLSLYLKDGFASTVTVFLVPEQTTSGQILDRMLQKHDILLNSSFGCFGGKVIRIGHMGENAAVEHMTETMDALDETLRFLGVPLKAGLKDAFLSAL